MASSSAAAADEPTASPSRKAPAWDANSLTRVAATAPQCACYFRTLRYYLLRTLYWSGPSSTRLRPGLGRWGGAWRADSSNSRRQTRQSTRALHYRVAVVVLVLDGSPKLPRPRSFLGLSLFRRLSPPVTTDQPANRVQSRRLHCANSKTQSTQQSQRPSSPFPYTCSTGFFSPLSAHRGLGAGA